MTRAAIYARVSTSDQSCDGQVERLSALARAHGWDPVVFRDEGISGILDNRPGLDRLRAAMRGRSVEIVLVTKLDRLGRSLLGIRRFWEEAELSGVRVMVADQGFDSSSSTGRLVRDVLGAIAEFERELILERTRAGVGRAVARGPKDPGSRASRGPRGFGRPRLVPDDLRQLIVERGRAGDSPKQIAIALKVKRSTVRSIIQAAKSPPPGSAAPGRPSPSRTITSPLEVQPGGGG